MEHKLKKGDLILIGCIVLLAILLLGARWLTNVSETKTNEDYYATIRVDNKVFKTVKLTEEPQIIEVKTETGYDILKVHDKGIEVIESDCPQKICFTFGLISKPKEVIICLPLKMYIEVNGSDNSSLDNEVDAYVK
ncbi:NusG domain II-containing protein [Paenibacillus vini]|uniref:NusG domain II-containing protein n=1 Tax=Paenibacillus vini TaxID=1476024 RepID=UPI0025B73157|nr:NusG domain II-containing protein [Paenibacillus vini]MDN4067612.1 NusG domain II-containing protein [Paenibacillus vini]